MGDHTSWVIVYELNNILEVNVRNSLGSNENSNNVFVYIADMANCKNKIYQFWECLSSLEKTQAQRYYTFSLQERYIISHGILRYILSHHTTYSPHSIEFIHNKYGKPFLKNSTIQFNMSHSNGMVSYVVALDCKVGIDIELYNDNLDIQGLSKLVLTPAEYKFLADLEPWAKCKFFYKIWTKKESLVKAIGTGLSYPINTIETIDISSGAKLILGNEQTEAEQLYCYTLEIPLNYSGAIAVEHKINKVIYVEMNNKHSVFDNARFQCFS